MYGNIKKLFYMYEYLPDGLNTTQMENENFIIVICTLLNADITDSDRYIAFYIISNSH